jgi:hypothetical protein
MLAGSGASATCQVSYTPTTIGNGQHTITAGYAGDVLHSPSSGQAVVQVSGRLTTAPV